VVRDIKVGPRGFATSLTVRRCSPSLSEAEGSALCLSKGSPRPPWDRVTTVVAERTFWDKIIILHGVRKWFENRGVLRYLGQRVSRHYYDVHRMLQSDLGARGVGDRALAAACAAHVRMFFNSPDLGLEAPMRS
jgi:Nucleotidyl transferase AbiEii toxin, Type IV TA system